MQRFTRALTTRLQQLRNSVRRRRRRSPQPSSLQNTPSQQTADNHDPAQQDPSSVHPTHNELLSRPTTPLLPELDIRRSPADRSALQLFRQQTTCENFGSEILADHLINYILRIEEQEDSRPWDDTRREERRVELESLRRSLIHDLSLATLGNPRGAPRQLTEDEEEDWQAFRARARAATVTIEPGEGSSNQRHLVQATPPPRPPTTTTGDPQATASGSSDAPEDDDEVMMGTSNQHLKPVSQVLAGDRIYCIEQARIQQEAIRKNFESDGKGVPPFDLVEMIGKGSYGRVYKARYHEPPHNTHEFVAIKVINADAQDYRTIAEERDNSFKDFKNELHILQVLSETKAKNINKVLDAFVLHSQLVWITEYCPGGSIRTIMTAQPGRKLAEKHVIPIAREIAVGLKCVHDAGIIHRDVKAANVLIHEDGRVQLCDFGTSTMLIGEVDKRSTILGTPHWMPLEMHEASEKKKTEYRTEVDVWAYGCTIWETLTGAPPNAGKSQNRQLEVSLRRAAPRLTSDEYSDKVKEFLEFILQSNPEQRPSMQEILNHPFLKDTEATHPISFLSELVADMVRFRHAGGQRQSLLHPGGALPPGIDSDLDREFRDSWNFSSTETFFNRHSRMMDLSALASLAEKDESGPLADSSCIKELTPIEQINFDERVRRGAEAMGGLFNESKPAYKYTAKRDFKEIKDTKRISDLPLRDATERSSVRDTQIDLGDFDESSYAPRTEMPVIQLADADTIRANRSNSRLFREPAEDQLTAKPGELEEYAISSGDESKRPPTMEWKFPAFAEPEAEPTKDSVAAEKTKNRATLEWTFPKDAFDEEAILPTRPTLKHAATEPIVLPTEAMILGEMLSSSPPGDSSFESEEIELPRPSTASSMSSDADYDPFKFDLDVNVSAVEPEARRALETEIEDMLNNAGYQAWKSAHFVAVPNLSESDKALFREYKNMAAPPSAVVHPVETPVLGQDGFPGQDMSIAGGMGTFSGAPAPAAAAAVLPSSQPDIMVGFPEIMAPSSAAMMQGATEEVMVAELDRLLGDWVDGMEAVGKAFGDLAEGEGQWESEEEAEGDDE